jgi:branched-subunit amino acid aminotransferase/4-amino-4-deoxychorismate lyase
MQEPAAFLNGQWIRASDAMVPVSDAGFVLGVTVAEQLRTFNGKIFHLEDHLTRLYHSLDMVGLRISMPRSQFAETACELVTRNLPFMASGDDMGLSIFVTPGMYPAYAACENPDVPVSSTVCMHTYSLPFHLWAKKYRDGQSLVATEIEQVPSQCWPTELKCRSRMHYYLADRRAAALDPQARALLHDAQGFVTETSTANLLIYTAAEGLVSPPPTKILHGISLSAARELARRLDIPWSDRDLTDHDVATADEVLLTSTPLCLLPVTRFNGRPIGNGKPGAVFSRLLDAWSAWVELDIAGQAEQFAKRRE